MYSLNITPADNEHKPVERRMVADNIQQLLAGIGKQVAAEFEVDNVIFISEGDGVYAIHPVSPKIGTLHIDLVEGTG